MKFSKNLSELIDSEILLFFATKVQKSIAYQFLQHKKILFCAIWQKKNAGDSDESDEEFVCGINFVWVFSVILFLFFGGYASSSPEM